MKPIIRKELIAVLLIGVVVAVANMLPYIYAYTSAPDDKRFTGTLSVWPEDTFYHLSFARQAEQGRWLFELKFMGNDVEERGIANGLFVVMGKVARWTGTALDTVFHLERFILTLVLCVVVYVFISSFFSGLFERMLALLLTVFASGAGWLSPSSIDVQAVEAQGFWYLRWEVVVIPTVILLVLAIHCYLRFLHGGELRRGLSAGAALLALVLVHPHDAITVIAVCGLTALPWLVPCDVSVSRRVKGLALLLVPALPVLVWHGLLVVGSDTVRDYAGIIDDIRFVPLCLGYGLPGVLAVIGAVQAVRANERLFIPCITWVAAAGVLLLVEVPPFSQYYLLHGLHVPLSILAVRGFSGLIHRREGRGRLGAFRTMAAAVLIGVSSITTFVLYARDLETAREHKSPWFVGRDTMAAFEWMHDHTDPEATVLASPKMSILIPYLAGNRVHLFAVDQTPDYSSRERAVEQLFFAPVPLDLIAFETLLVEFRADYLVVREDEPLYETLAAMSPLPPALESVYEHGGVRIYRIIGEHVQILR